MAATQEELLVETMRVPTSKRETVGAILKQIIAENGGILTPEHLVELVEPVDHPLHKYFTWDNQKAGEILRLHEARAILRVAVEFIGPSREAVRVAVHLSSDAVGYRLLSEVLSDEEMRTQLLSDAARDVDVFRRKYEALGELKPIVSRLTRAVAKARAKHGRKRG